MWWSHCQACHPVTWLDIISEKEKNNKIKKSEELLITLKHSSVKLKPKDMSREAHDIEVVPLDAPDDQANPYLLGVEDGFEMQDPGHHVRDGHSAPTSTFDVKRPMLKL